jgi:DNA recombination protein RmuC
LGESFKQVTEHLQAVHSGFGEMRHLAGSVTDLRRIMGNVKTRGTWGEAQLANVLEQIFAPSQYERNFRPRPQSREAVEFALRLPGADAQAGPVYLPIDSKFPVEDFEAARIAHADLINQVITCARSVRDKYIDVPTTTNFAVLFLPSEGLYAEVVREPGLVEKLLREYKVVIQGPTTFAAFSMALLMGFTTLAIQRRSADIQKLLGAIKSDFGKFGELLGKVEDRLDGAKQNIGLARDRSRQIVKKLDKVEQLPEDEAKLLLPDPDQDPDAIA